MPRKLLIPTALAVLLLGAVADAEKPATREALSLEKILEIDETSPPRPSQVQWTHDGRVSFFLKTEAEAPASEQEAAEDDAEAAEDDAEAPEDDAEAEASESSRDLWVVEISTGERRILVSAQELRDMAPSPTEATSDERERTRRSRFEVAAYRWSPAGDEILFASSGQLVLYTLENKKKRVLAPSKTGVLDPKFSPDGSWVSFVHEHDIWIVPAKGGPELQLTTGGHDLLFHGDLDWVYPEEFRVRTGYHWSPDSRRIAFLELDESPVPTHPISEEVSWQATVDLQRYPKPGDPNPKARVGIANLDSKKTVWLDRAAEYIPRIDWADADHLAVQLLDRAQEELELVLATAATGRSRSVFFERDEHWINLTKDLTFLDGTDRFLWTSERSGLRHIYLYRRDGSLLRQLTAGEFQVGEIEGVDQAGGWIYFSSNERNLLGSDLYRVRLDGSGKERLTEASGRRRLEMNEDATAFLDAYSSLEHPGGQNLHELASGRVTEITAPRDFSHLQLVTPRMKELEAPDGALVRVLLLAPENPPPDAKLPVLCFVYGMAGAPVIRDEWLAGGIRGLFHQFLVQQGYVVAYIDDRSSSIPGHRYAVAADHDIGPVAAADHAVAVEYLKTLPFVDGERMAVWGWSGGGFTTAFHMGHTDLFRVGVAGAPPTDWRLYDSIYTERYMGLPDEDPEAYERTSAIAGAKSVTGRLLLIHGTHDDNVHLQNTLKMADALIRAGKQFDLMLYPNKTHGIAGKQHRLHMYTLIFDYLQRHL